MWRIYSEKKIAVLAAKVEPKALTNRSSLLWVFYSKLFFFYNQVNVTSSRVPDHCSKYALNDPTDSSFRGSCDHTHDILCKQCEELKTVLSDIQAAILNNPFELENEQYDALHVFQEAVPAIESWKAHQLRVVSQDKARMYCREM